jgi:alpha-glucan,water dikinase
MFGFIGKGAGNG